MYAQTSKKKNLNWCSHLQNSHWQISDRIRASPKWLLRIPKYDSNHHQRYTLCKDILLSIYFLIYCQAYKRTHHNIKFMLYSFNLKKKRRRRRKMERRRKREDGGRGKEEEGEEEKDNTTINKNKKEKKPCEWDFGMICRSVWTNHRVVSFFLTTSLWFFNRCWHFLNSWNDLVIGIWFPKGIFL